jgi:N-acetyl-gamma-glutamyl-phosphate reductase
MQNTKQSTMNKKIRVGIAGGAGYTGGELVRLLINHPHAEIVFVQSKSNAGVDLAKVHGDLIGDTNLKFADAISDKIDVLFLCVSHGEARKFLNENAVPGHIRIIDLSQDFRLKAVASWHSPAGSRQPAQSAVGRRQSPGGGVQSLIKVKKHAEANSQGHLARNFVYGLPELNREQIRNAKNVANPGCFATAIQLGLLPLAKYGLLDSVYTTGITGSTGAGQALTATSHFSWRANNIQAYKTLSHQHMEEIGESLLQLQPNKNINLSFVPWRGDFTRGIFITSLINCESSAKELNAMFEDFYGEHPFTMLGKDPIYLKQAVNTNKCIIQLEKIGAKLVIHSIIDNLLKGASGQAVQNMNLMFGFDERAGLRLKANFF